MLSSRAERPIHLVRQKRPERFERAKIDRSGGFQLSRRQFRVIHIRGETLLAPRIPRRGKGPADIAAKNLRARGAQLRQRPLDVCQGEAAALPIGHGVLRPQTIKVDRDIEIRPVQRADELLETLPPVSTEDHSGSSSIGGRPAIRPGVDLQSSGPFRATIAEQPARPPALEIPAAPHAHFFHEWQFERPIHPAATAPVRRTHIPIRMIVERDQNEWLRHPARPER
jgi:hypothetical protein